MDYWYLKIYSHYNSVGIHKYFPHINLIIGWIDPINEVWDLFHRTGRGYNHGEILEHFTDISSILLIIESWLLLKIRVMRDFSFNAQDFIFIVDRPVSVVY